MLHQFKRFLVIKVAERLQEISHQKCSGCTKGLLLDQLHPCQTLSLKGRLSLFLVKAVEEAVSKIDALFNMFKQTTWTDDTSFIEEGKSFLVSLTVDDLRDRRYINEDTVLEHPYNSSWARDLDFIPLEPPSTLTLDVSPTLPVAVETTLPPILPLDTVETPKPKKRKRTKNKETQELPNI